MRNSKQIEAILAAYCTRQLLAVTNKAPRAIAIEELPLARIKRIMKQDSCDPSPRQVSSDAVALMTYSAQIFLCSLASLAWQISTAPGKRNTLQVRDLKAAAFASSRFDFLIDVIDLFEQQQQQQQSVALPANALACSWPSTQVSSHPVHGERNLSAGAPMTVAPMVSSAHGAPLLAANHAAPPGEDEPVTIEEMAFIVSSTLGGARA